jgi:hypothetical protein
MPFQDVALEPEATFSVVPLVGSQARVTSMHTT